MIYVLRLLDDAEIRAVPHMESMISIFKSLDATFNALVFQFQSPGKSILIHTSVFLFIFLMVVKYSTTHTQKNWFNAPDAGRSLEQSPVSVNADKSRNEQSVKAIIRSNDLSKEIHRHNGHGMPWNVVNHLGDLPSSDRKEDLKNERYNAEEIDLNQLQQQSPGSAHSSDSNKDIVKETSELRVRNTIKFHKLL